MRDTVGPLALPRREARSDRKEKDDDTHLERRHPLVRRGRRRTRRHAHRCARRADDVERDVARGHGRALRNPQDPQVREIGEELAAARALRDLADRLLRATSDDIAQIEHRPVRLR
nr:hypothetical protein GCM10025730_10430 [Promicromonospora thailandica]